MLGVSYEEYEANKDRPDLVAKRVLAKTVNFGVLYGMGPTKLAWKTGVTMDEAKDFIAQYFATYPGVKRFIDNTKTFVGRNGFVETISGRKRRLPDALSPDKAINSMAEREAVNSIIQGSAADFTKRAGLEQAALIEANRWPYQLLLQIHDELLYEVQRDWLQHNQKTLTILSDAMANVYKLRVPIIVSQEVLSRWGDKTVLEDDDSEDDLVA
jgi:DNA polymerase-1